MSTSFIHSNTEQTLVDIMFASSVLLWVLLLFIDQINGRAFQLRQTDSLVVLREKCEKTPYASECTQIKQQMEELLRKCKEMVTPVSACKEVSDKYCFIWPKELFCYSPSGGGQFIPSWNTDPDWYQIPTDTSEFRSRGEYCITHSTEQKCINLLNAIKSRYVDCSSRPATDVGCQNFKVSLCSAYPKFAPCLNGSSG